MYTCIYTHLNAASISTLCVCERSMWVYVGVDKISWHVVRQEHVDHANCDPAICFNSLTSRFIYNACKI